MPRKVSKKAIHHRFRKGHRFSKSFRDSVFGVVKKIPRGSVLTYKEVARKVGRPNAYRAVGSILKQNFDPQIPCHRVIRSDGEIGEYNRGASNKRRMLIQEGVEI